MDRTDYLILNLLQKDSRITLRRIGEQVGLTPPAVSERIMKMEDAGIIREFRITVDRTLVDSSITGFILVSPEPDCYAAFCEFCEKNDHIIEHYHVVGEYNALLRFAVKDTKELDRLLAGIKAYGDSRTSVELKSYFSCKDIPLPTRE